MVYLILLTAAAPGCRKPYAPGPISSPGTYLVVEGVIDPGADSTIIKLSNTVNIAGNTSSAVETNARVTIENEGGPSYTLTERTPYYAGQYLAVGLSLDKTKKYRLYIKTSGGNEYASDYVLVKPTPPIDSVTYKITPKGLQINSNTHDAANSTRYYRMAYEETWKYHAMYNSELIIKNGEIVSRREDEQIYYCYRGDKSANIILASSEKLSQDVIFEHPIILIPPSSEKLTIKYSILLKQYALTKEAYAFWENIRKNTERLGSIFDAQPSQLKGNIHGITNPGETVIGYVSVATMQTKRIFIDNNLFPNTWYVPDNGRCEKNAYRLNNNGENDVDLFIIKGGLVPITAIISPFPRKIVGYEASTIECTDCTLKGTTTAPPYWEF
jgi:Domain of unknown function (DUF4249)